MKKITVKSNWREKRDRGKHRDRDRGRETETETDQRDRETETETERETETETETDQRDREKETENHILSRGSIDLQKLFHAPVAQPLRNSRHQLSAYESTVLQN